MTLEERAADQEVKKYDFTVKSLYLVGETVFVVLDVCYSRATLVPLFSVEIEVERKEDTSLSYYELVAIKKAASLIRDIADKLSVAA